MRRTLIKQLIKQDTKDTYFLTAGVGYGVLEPLRKKMGDRFIDVGIAEPTMISIAAGLALSGKTVWTYTMACFYLRTLEQVKLDLCSMNLPVTMIGCGVGFEYEQHGVSHFALEDDKIMECLLNIDVHTPKDKKEMLEIIKQPADKPRYIRIGRFDENKDFPNNLHILQKYPTEGGSLQYFREKYK